MRSTYPHPDSPKTFFFLQRKNKCPEEIFAGYHPGVVQGTVPENWSENGSIFQRLDTIFDPIKCLKTATTRTGHGGFRTIYGGFSSWSNLTWAYFFISWVETRPTRKIVQHHLSSKDTKSVWLKFIETHMEVHVFQIRGLWFCSCCFGFCKGHRCSIKNSSRHCAFYADFGALHHIKGLSCKQTNSLKRHVSVWGFCRMRVFFWLLRKTKKLQLQFGGCLDCQFWQCLNVKQFSYVCVINTWTCCSKPSRRDVSSVQSPIDIQLFWLG